jgi:hypothetical protein
MAVRVHNQVHLGHPWRIHDVLRDFTLEDVWMLPEVTGSADDFPRAVALLTDGDPATSSNLPARVLWQARELLGRWFDLDAISQPGNEGGGYAIPGTAETTLADRLPEDLRGTADGVRFENLPFTALYRTDDEFAAEISNKTVHGVLHLGWLPKGGGAYQGQLTVYVKPRGPFGSAYMAFIKPFRYLIVYPALERQLATRWARRQG